jgi:hypothetical protein
LAPSIAERRVSVFEVDTPAQLEWRRYLPGEPHPNAWVTRIATAIV